MIGSASAKVFRKERVHYSVGILFLLLPHLLSFAESRATRRLPSVVVFNEYDN